jgi:predicted CXXCH cytochrome family protein
MSIKVLESRFFRPRLPGGSFRENRPLDPRKSFLLGGDYLTVDGLVRLVVMIAVLVILPLMLYGGDCTTSECHTEFKQMKKVHFPAQDNCTRCHEKIGDHKFKLIEQRELCFDCHDENRKRKYVHEAVISLECSSCHNSHGGNYKYYLLSERIDTMCFECHDKAPMTKKVLHQPLAEGDCTGCHKPHSSDYPVLLISKKEEFCVKCHEDMAFLLKKSDKLKVHSIVGEGCENCHNPHSTDYQYMLSAAPGEICGSCHEEIGEKAKSAKYKHLALEKEKKCLTCHDAHASAFASNLIKKQTELCIDCHNKWIKGTDGKEFNIYKMVKDSPYKHAPLEDGECLACHDPHGGDFFKILKAGYPPRFYSEFKEENYELCFQRHDSALAAEKSARNDTNFRDGTRNLHYVHVNLKKGRTCRACHEVHAGKNNKLVRDHVPFGKWSLPINFKKTEDGGSCTPGCHKSFTYSRASAPARTPFQAKIKKNEK